MNISELNGISGLGSPFDQFRLDFPIAVERDAPGRGAVDTDRAYLPPKIVSVGKPVTVHSPKTVEQVVTQEIKRNTKTVASPTISQGANVQNTLPTATAVTTTKSIATTEEPKKGSNKTPLIILGLVAVGIGIAAATSSSSTPKAKAKPMGGTPKKKKPTARKPRSAKKNPGNRKPVAKVTFS